MLISLLQLNMNGDNYWENVIKHIRNNDYDLIHLQEVTGNKTIIGNLNSKRDVFAELQNALHDYNGELMITDHVDSGGNAYFGNAIFYKKDFILVSKKLVYFKKNTGLLSTNTKSFEGLSRGLLHLTLRRNAQTISTMTLHGAWAKTPHEEAHQTKQAEVLFHYLESAAKPFILSGDFNLDPQEPTIKRLSHTLTNAGFEAKITNTLNLREHRAREHFPQGVVVDYIFASKNIGVKSCEVIAEEDLSDHLGLRATFEV